MSGEVLLEKWWNIKQQLKKLAKEEEEIKENVKRMMNAKGLNSLRSKSYTVNLRNVSRTSLSQKDCPASVWSQYAKKTSYSMIKLDLLGEESKDLEE